MLLKALDLLRTIGWGIVHFIFDLINSLYEIMQELNSIDIINTLSENTIFTKFYSGIITIALTLFGLFVIWQFVNKIIDPEEGQSIKQICMEVAKCGLFIVLTTFLFSQVATFSIKLAGYTSNILSSETNVGLGTSMLTMYVGFNDAYEDSDEFKNEDYISAIKDETFTDGKKYNDKFVTNDRFIIPNEKDYKYDINWIMAILCGGFYLYTLVFAGMMLGRRQIEFLFLFVISPVIFATSVGNKQRRGAVIEQLVSLTLQSAVVMLIINITAIIMMEINNTTFFTGGFQDVVLKSLLYIGCASFLLTGSQMINRFIGANVSAASGREQLMSLMGYGQVVGGLAGRGASLGIGAGLLAGGAGMKGLSKVADKTHLGQALAKPVNSLVSQAGQGISTFGASFGTPPGSDNSSGNVLSKMMHSTGDKINSFGAGITSRAKTNIADKKGFGINSKLNRGSSNMMKSGVSNITSAMSSKPIRRNFNNPYSGRNKI